MKIKTVLLVCLLYTIQSNAQQYYMFIGTYTTGKSEGIYVYKFDAAKGTASAISTIKSQNPSYLTVSTNGKYLYAVNEVGGGGSGEVSSFSFDKSAGKLSFINKQTSAGADPCYISESHDQKWVLVANYSGGNLSALPVKADGSLEAPAQVIQHIGTGKNPDRQEKAHVHSVVFSPDEQFAFAADLGMDRESIYRFHPGAARPLGTLKDSFVSTDAGAGPRHFVFHPNKKFAYLINELTGTVNAFRYTDGKLKGIQQISTHPEGYTGGIGSADIHVSPDGKFLYASNRGDANSIAIFSVDAVTGKLKIKGFQSTNGKTPRNFMIDPSGRFLLVANQETGNIVIFRRNMQTGLLKETGHEIQVPNPVCIKMWKI